MNSVTARGDDQAAVRRQTSHDLLGFLPVWQMINALRRRQNVFRRRCGCGDATVLDDDVVVSMSQSSTGVVQPSQMRLASLRRSIKNASMADLAQSEV
jgi:hypothetical protein